MADQESCSQGEDHPLKENHMRFTSPSILSFALLVLARDSLLAQDYLTKDGQLAQQLKLVQLQGGFAGFTGVQFTIAPDGSWTSESIFNEKKAPKNKGKLSEKDLVKLGAILEKYDVAKLPAKSGKQPGANPHTITFEYGKMKASLVGQMPPKLDPKNPTGTIESRFAGIWEGVVALLTPPVPPKEGQGDAKDEAIKKDRKQIEGTWRVIALEVDGNKAMEEDAKKLSVVNGTDGTWSLLSEGKEISKGTSTIDPSKKPKAINFTPTEGEGKGNQYLGIYELGEKTRKLCFAPPGKERPTEFSSMSGTEHILVTFEREKKQPGKEDAEAAAEMKANIEKTYIVLYRSPGSGLQFVTEKKAAVLDSPAETKLLVISKQEATSIIDHLAEQGMFAKAHQPFEGVHPAGWFLHVGPSKKHGRCAWTLGPEHSLVRHMLRTLTGDNKTALQDWLKAGKPKSDK